MSLFNEDGPDPVVPPPPVTPKIQPDSYKGITIDTEYTPSSALLTWVEGSNWTVNYYSQVLDAHSEPTAQALDRDPIYQQYKLIRNMDLKVTTPLSFSPDPTVRTMEVNGAGITYPFLVPNVGDMFVADIGDGRVGVFTIIEANRATILRDSVYNIEYRMVSELTSERQLDLERKTIQTFYYSQTSLVQGSGPFVTEPAHARHKVFDEQYRELVSRYLTDFLSNEYRTLMVPDQLQRTYDHWVVRTCIQLLDATVDKRVRQIRELNVMGDPIMQQPTLWDAVVRLADQRLYGACHKAHLVSTQNFKGRPVMQGLGFTGISRLVFPIDAPTDVDSQYKGKNTKRPQGLPFKEGRPRRPQSGEYLDQTTRNPIWFQSTPLMDGVPPWKLPPDIYPVVRDDYYVLSETFYTEDRSLQSKLEMLVWQAIRREELNLEQLESLFEHIYDWDNLERFYYYPLVFMLLKVAGVR